MADIPKLLECPYCAENNTCGTCRNNHCPICHGKGTLIKRSIPDIFYILALAAAKQEIYYHTPALFDAYVIAFRLELTEFQATTILKRAREEAESLRQSDKLIIEP